MKQLDSYESSRGANQAQIQALDSAPLGDVSKPEAILLEGVLDADADADADEGSADVPVEEEPAPRKRRRNKSKGAIVDGVDIAGVSIDVARAQAQLQPKFVNLVDLLPPLPNKGDFDVNTIKGSAYFFS